MMNETLAETILGAYAAAFPPGSTLELLTANGTVLVSIELPEFPWRPPWRGTLDSGDLWQGRATAGGRAARYRLTGPSGATEEGSVGELGSGADMEMDPQEVEAGEYVTLASFRKEI